MGNTMIDLVFRTCQSGRPVYDQGGANPPFIGFLFPVTERGVYSAGPGITKVAPGSFRTGSFGIVEAAPESIRFTADRDMDGEIDDPDLAGGLIESNLEQIAFSFDENTNLLEMILYKSDDTIEIRDTMLDNVSNLNFTYLNADDAVTADLNEIRTVIIALTVIKPAGRGDPVSRTLTKRIRCRNLDF